MGRLGRAVGMVGTGCYLPERVLANGDLEKMVDTTDEWIVSRTGISTRRIAAPEEATSDLAVRASLAALDSAAVRPEDVDLIIVATVTPDMMFPATACLVQHRIGAAKAGAFDLLVGCTGFLYGVALGAQAIGAGLYETVLVVAADTLSKITDWTDRSTCVLFGDGAGAVVLRPVGEDRGILSVRLGSDGSGGDFLCMPAGGSRLPASLETVNRRLHYIKMEGGEVFKFAVRAMGDGALAALKACGLGRGDVDYFIPHQANLRIIEAASRRLRLSPEKVAVNLDRYGNMSAASIPVALDEMSRAGKLEPGHVLVLVSFGAGLSWASMVVRW